MTLSCCIFAGMESRTKYFLRPGDMRPESLTDSVCYPDMSTAYEQLELAGNLFDSEAEAIEASIAVRAELKRLKSIRQELQEYNRLRGMRLNTTPLFSRQP